MNLYHEGENSSSQEDNQNGFNHESFRPVSILEKNGLDLNDEDFGEHHHHRNSNHYDNYDDHNNHFNYASRQSEQYMHRDSHYQQRFNYRDSREVVETHDIYNPED